MTLRTITTTYARGAVVKLSHGHTDQPAAKFIVQALRGVFLVRRCSPGQQPEQIGSYASRQSAIDHAERECERIRRVIEATSRAG